MFLFHKPVQAEIDSFLDRARQEEFSYAHVGQSSHVAEPPYGYIVDQRLLKVGNGEKHFQRACRAVDQWKMFNLDWITIYGADTEPAPGQTVCVMANHFRFWSLNACRVVDLVNMPNGNLYGFAYGTLDSHSERGEERFTVMRDPETGDVYFSIFAFSQPANVFVALGLPVARILQKRFAREASAAVKSYVIERKQ